MKGRGRGFLAGIAVGAALLAPGLGHAARIVLPQPGDIGFAGFAQYGAFTKTGEIGESFGTGAGYGVRLRYRMRYERALGLTFERQGFDPRSGCGNSDTGSRRGCGGRCASGKRMTLEC